MPPGGSSCSPAKASTSSTAPPTAGAARGRLDAASVKQAADLLASARAAAAAIERLQATTVATLAQLESALPQVQKTRRDVAAVALAADALSQTIARADEAEALSLFVLPHYKLVS